MPEHEAEVSSDIANTSRRLRSPLLEYEPSQNKRVVFLEETYYVGDSDEDKENTLDHLADTKDLAKLKQDLDKEAQIQHMMQDSLENRITTYDDPKWIDLHHLLFVSTLPHATSAFAWPLPRNTRSIRAIPTLGIGKNDLSLYFIVADRASVSITWNF